MSLRKKLIRLAYQKPRLRPHLLPLLKEAGCGCEKQSGCGDGCDCEGSPHNSEKLSKTNRQAVSKYSEVLELEAGRRYDPVKKKRNKDYGPPYKDRGGKWKPKNRGQGRCYYQTGDESDRCYVTTNGGPGGKKKKDTGPAGKDRSEQRKVYNKKYEKARWPKGNRSQSQRAKTRRKKQRGR